MRFLDKDLIRMVTLVPTGNLDFYLRGRDHPAGFPIDYLLFSLETFVSFVVEPNELAASSKASQ